MVALFKEEIFIGYAENDIEAPHLQKKEIPNHQQNLQKWKWEGSFSTGKMIPIDVNQLEQEELAITILDQIFEKYPPEIQIPLLMKEVYCISSFLRDSNKHYTPHNSFSDMAEKLLWAIDKFKPTVNYLKKLYKRN
jgi:hypothetical protein